MYREFVKFKENDKYIVLSSMALSSKEDFLSKENDSFLKNQNFHFSICGESLEELRERLHKTVDNLFDGANKDIEEKSKLV